MFQVPIGSMKQLFGAKDTIPHHVLSPTPRKRSATLDRASLIITRVTINNCVQQDTGTKQSGLLRHARRVNLAMTKYATN